MAYMTPDLTTLLGQDQSMSQIVNGPQPANQDNLLQMLLAQHMTRGLGMNPNQEGQPMFSGPQAGYAGPTRRSDVPGQRVAQVQPSNVSDAQDLARGIKIPNATGSVQNLEQLIPMIQALKALGPDAESELMTRMGIGAPAGQESKHLRDAKALADYNHALGAPDRAINQEIARARVLDAKARVDQLAAEAEARNRIPMKDAKASMTGAYGSGTTDPIDLQQLAKSLGYSYQGGSRNTFLGVPYGDFQPRLGVNQPVPQGAPSALAPKPGQAPAQTQPQQPKAPSTQGKVVVEKGGKRFTLDVGELEQAQKEGYKLVR